LELTITINITELLGKSKEIDLAKVLEAYQDIQAGKEVSFLKGMIKVRKVENLVADVK
jgi:hypothetical protein